MACKTMELWGCGLNSGHQVDIYKKQYRHPSECKIDKEEINLIDFTCLFMAPKIRIVHISSACILIDRGSKNLSWGGHKTREDLSHHLHCKEKEAYDVAQRMAMTTRGIGESKAYQESVMTLHAGVVAGIEEINGELTFKTANNLKDWTENYNCPVHMELKLLVTRVSRTGFDQWNDTLQIEAGEAHFVLLFKGVVFTWGHHLHRSLGRSIDRKTSAFSPHPLPMKLPPFRKIAAGGFVSAALTEDNKLYLWGCSTPYIVGEGPSRRFPLHLKEVPTVEDIHGLLIIDVAVGQKHIVVLARDARLNLELPDSVWIVGDSSVGQTGLDGDQLDLDNGYDVDNEKVGPVPVAWHWMKLDLVDRVAPKNSVKKVVGVAAGPKNTFLIIECLKGGYDGELLFDDSDSDEVGSDKEIMAADDGDFQPKAMDDTED